MSLVELTDKKKIHDFFLFHDPALHIYEIGDLDDFFFPKTKWYGLEDQHHSLKVLALLYSSPDLTVLLMFGDDVTSGRRLLTLLCPILPPNLYSQLSPRLLEALTPRYSADHHGMFCKFYIRDMDKSSRLCLPYAHGAERLSTSDLVAIETFYRVAYPGNWFDPRMLETGQTYGIWNEDHSQLVAIAGIHVYSVEYRVAALGNIASHPSRRREGLARKVAATLILSLMHAGIRTIGLNVHAENEAAIECYKSLGFEKLAIYEENMLTDKSQR